MSTAPYADEATLLRDAVEHIIQLGRTRKSLLVSIDGVGGSGKTTLAKRLSALCGLEVVSVDDYVTPHQGSYLPHIAYARLKADLEAFRSTGQRVVVEGLLVAAVLRQVNAEPDVSIYIRRIGPDGQWDDSSVCSEENDLQEVFAWLARFERLRGIGDHDRELAKYHVECRPISSADFVYDRRHIPPHVSASA